MHSGIPAIGAAAPALDPALLSRSGNACAHCGAHDRGAPPVITQFVRVVVPVMVSAVFALPPAAASAQPARACPQDAAPASTGPPPSNITVDDLLQPLVSALLGKSAFFKQQW